MPSQPLERKDSARALSLNERRALHRRFLARKLATLAQQAALHERLASSVAAAGSSSGGRASADLSSRTSQANQSSPSAQAAALAAAAHKAREAERAAHAAHQVTTPRTEKKS
jgi:hypothetical protein